VHEERDLFVRDEVFCHWVATISRFLKIIGLICRIQSIYRALLRKRRVILRSLLIVANPYETRDFYLRGKRRTISIR